MVRQQLMARAETKGKGKEKEVRQDEKGGQESEVAGVGGGRRDKGLALASMAH